MCGFVASFCPEPARPLPVETLRRMCDVMAHRGPDNYATYVDNHVSLAHRRLSIIDLTAAANQPFTKGDLTVVYNGEVYNYIELAQELEDDHGSVFQTRSDVEVILEAYDKIGQNCVDRFNGMFSFAVWNERQRTLFVARDRLGVKPLFYLQKGNSWIFASDLRSLWEVHSPVSNVNPSAIYNYLGQSFISTEETSTRGVFKFPPGEVWTVSERGKQRRIYWDLNSVRTNPAMGFKDATAQAECLLEDALRIRLRSDVPVGCFLSGGVDSSLVVAMTAKALGTSFHTFSIGFDAEEHDETPFVKRVLARYKTHHEHRQLNSGCLEALPQIVSKYSELFGDASAVATYFVSEAARSKLTVVLTGDGADEAFGGYIDPYALHLARLYRRLPTVVRQRISGWFGRDGANSSGRWSRRAKRFAEIADCGCEEAYIRLKSSGWNRYPEAYVDSEHAVDTLSLNYLRRCSRSGDVDRMLYADITERQCHDFLVKVDMATMAHSIEARSPYLDYRVVELGYALDHRIRYRRFERKAVLKAVARKYVDSAVIDRRKMGFSIPQARWLQEKRWAPIVRSIVSRRSLLDEFISRPVIRETLAAFEEGNSSEANRVWLLLWFQIWEGLFISRVYRPTQRLSDLV